MSASVSQDYRNLLRRAHRRFVRAEALDSAGAVITELPVESGDAKFDGSSASGWRSGKIVVASPEFVPTDEDSPLAPFSKHRIRLSIGVEHGNPDTVEWCSLGLFLVTEVANDRPFAGLSVTLTDLAFLAAQDQIDDTWTFPTTAVAADEIVKVLTPVMGAVTVVRDDSGGARLGTYVQYPEAGASRWSVALGMAGKVGTDLYIDDDGGLVMHDPAAARPVSETISTGDDGVITQLSSKVSRLTAKNRVVVIQNGRDGSTGKGDARIVPPSPLAYDGKFGKVTEAFREEPDHATDASAQAEADRILARQAGLARTLSIVSAPMPHLRPYDELLVRFPNGAEEHARIQAVTHGLGPGDTTRIETRWDPAGVIGPMSTRDKGFLAGEK